ncbi:MAG: hypothetical protein B7Z59_11620, partial [Acidiphilium sp. 37-67-22]
MMLCPVDNPSIINPVKNFQSSEKPAAPIRTLTLEPCPPWLVCVSNIDMSDIDDIAGLGADLGADLAASLAVSLADRLARILAGLTALVAARGLAAGLAGPVIVGIARRLSRLGASFAAAASRPVSRRA